MTLQFCTKGYFIASLLIYNLTLVLFITTAQDRLIIHQQTKLFLENNSSRITLVNFAEQTGVACMPGDRSK